MWFQGHVPFLDHLGRLDCVHDTILFTKIKYFGEGSFVQNVILQKKKKSDIKVIPEEQNDL